MQHLEVSSKVRRFLKSLGFKGLTGSDVGGRWHNEKWSLRSMATERMQTSQTLTTTFKDYALDVTFILHWMKRVCVKFWKFAITFVQKI